VDLLCLDIEAHVRDAPRRLQAKRHCEQARLGPHGSPPSAGIREHYSAKVHRCRQQIRRVRRCDIYGLRAGRASRREHNIWCCPKRHQTRQTHTNREGTKEKRPDHPDRALSNFGSGRLALCYSVSCFIVFFQVFNVY